jgi:hypothetical protein
MPLAIMPLTVMPLAVMSHDMMPLTSPFDLPTPLSNDLFSFF